MNISYKILRVWAILKKEAIIMRRDISTYLILLLIPFAQVLFFGFVINTDAKNLATVVVSHDHSIFTNDLISTIQNTGYFKVIKVIDDDLLASKLLRSGRVTFVFTIPEYFERDLIRSRNPHILLEGDATDPAAVINGFRASANITNVALNQDLVGSLNYLRPSGPAFNIDTHAKYNSALLSVYHSLPGLLTSVLTVSLVALTAISVISEYEQGTMENLLITPVHSSEIIIGKIIPQVVLGYAIFFLTIGASYWLFNVPFYGSLVLLTAITLPFIFCNLAFGLAISTVSKTPLRAQNLASSYTLPAILLSGFLFPFYAMPNWAQWVGNIFPNAHYLRIISGIMLKGATFNEVWPDIWPIIVFMFAIVFISIKFYRKTLD